MSVGNVEAGDEVVEEQVFEFLQVGNAPCSVVVQLLFYGLRKQFLLPVAR